MSPRRIIAPVLAALALAAPAHAETAPYDAAFVSAFEKACVPGRLSFDGTKAQALAEGWTEVAEADHPELEAMMVLAKAAAVDPEYPDWKTDFAVYRSAVLDAPAYLVVTYLVAPDVINMIGCYLYDFEQTAMIDPATVTALLGNPIASSTDEQGLVNYVWGPACPMPRTFDTHLTLIKSDSPHLASTGFSGLMLKFETSEPLPGEDVPKTYC